MHRLVFAFALALPAALGWAQSQPAPKAPPAKRSLPPEALAEMKKHGHGEGALRPGDAAVDFHLRQLNSSTRISLSSYQGKTPVALIFGSYT